LIGLLDVGCLDGEIIGLLDFITHNPELKTKNPELKINMELLNEIDYNLTTSLNFCNFAAHFEIYNYGF